MFINVGLEYRTSRNQTDDKTFDLLCLRGLLRVRLHPGFMLLPSLKEGFSQIGDIKCLLCTKNVVSRVTNCWKDEYIYRNLVVMILVLIASAIALNHNGRRKPYS